MIVIIGHLTDPTTVHTLRAANRGDFEFTFLDLRAFLERGDFYWESLTKRGFLELDGQRLNFPSNDITGIYCRLIDISDRFTGPLQRRMHSRVVGLTKILNETDTFVVNRPGWDISNAAKVYHSELLRDIGFSIPDYILTNDPTDARAFLEAHPDSIYKGASSAKTIAAKVTPEALERLEDVTHTPVLFQQRICGDEIRAHVVGDKVFAERIITDAIDYRFDPNEKEMQPTEIPQDIFAYAQAYRRQSGLTLIGIDFRVTEAGDFYVLEANPMPGYDGYDRRAHYAISDELMRLLKQGGLDHEKRCHTKAS